MRLWPGSLGMRLLLALVFAMVVVAVLALTVEQFDSGPKPTNRGQLRGTPKPVDSMPPGVIAAFKRSEAGRDQVPSSAPFAARAASLGMRLQPLRGKILFASRELAMPPDITPVVEILTDGSLVLRRPPPLAGRPGAPNAMSHDGFGAGIVLPAQLGGLSAAARAALVAILGRWVSERPIATGRFRAADLALPKASLRRLLSWVP